MPITPNGHPGGVHGRLSPWPRGFRPPSIGHRFLLLTRPPAPKPPRQPRLSLFTRSPGEVTHRLPESSLMPSVAGLVKGGPPASAHSRPAPGSHRERSSGSQTTHGNSVTLRCNWNLGGELGGTFLSFFLLSYCPDGCHPVTQTQEAQVDVSGSRRATVTRCPAPSADTSQVAVLRPPLLTKARAHLVYLFF